MIVLTSWALWEVEKKRLDVEWGRARVEWECMLHLWNVAASHYLARLLGNTVQGSEAMWVDLSGVVSRTGFPTLLK